MNIVANNQDYSIFHAATNDCLSSIFGVRVNKEQQ